MAEKKPMSEARARSQRENAKKPRIAVPHGVREEAVTKKAHALKFLLNEGLNHIIEAIKAGPGEIELDYKGDATTDCTEQFQRFKWACEFVGDRCGLSKRHETAIEGEAMPEIVVKFANHPRPADS